MKTTVFAMLLLVAGNALGFDNIETYRHSGSIVALEVAGARPDSCAPETRNKWLARDQGSVLQLFYWDNLLGSGCSSAPTTYAVNLSIRDICINESACVGDSIELYSVSGCNPDSPRVIRCIEERAQRVVFNEIKGTAPRFNRTTSGPWFGAEQRLTLVSGQDHQGTLYSDGSLGSSAYVGSFDDNVFLGTSNGRTAFAYMDGANTLISDVVGRSAQHRRRDDGGRFIVTLGEFEGSALVTSPILVGGTYLVLDPNNAARKLKITGVTSSTAVMRVDDRYGGGIMCNSGVCLLEYATSSGSSRMYIDASDFGYEALLHSGSPGGVFAVRVAP